MKKSLKATTCLGESFCSTPPGSSRRWRRPPSPPSSTSRSSWPTIPACSPETRSTRARRAAGSSSARETGIPDQGGARWALDHLFLDQDGVPTLVEVKRGTDPRTRREAVGQMLDYAANCVLYWTAESIQGWLAKRCQDEGGLDPDEQIARLLGEPAATGDSGQARNS